MSKLPLNNAFYRENALYICFIKLIGLIGSCSKCVIKYENEMQQKKNENRNLTWCSDDGVHCWLVLSLDYIIN